MKDEDKTREQLVDELHELRTKVRNLQESKKRLSLTAGLPDGHIGFCRDLIENSPIAIFAIDRQHHVVHWNGACAKLTGVSADDMIGTSHQWKAFYAHARPCLSDIVMDGGSGDLCNLYSVYSASVLLSNGLHAEGWYPRLGGMERYIIFDAAPICNSMGEIVLVVETLQDITEQKRAERERELLIAKLQDALSEIKTLQGLLPICASCKKIRDDRGQWNELEAYISERSQAQFSHGLCPQCIKKLYPGYLENR